MWTPGFWSPLDGPTANQTIVQLYTRDQTGAVKVGAVVKFQITAAPSGSGSAFDAAILSITSNGSGLVSTALPTGATVKYWATKGHPIIFVVPATGPYDLPDIVGTFG